MTAWRAAAPARRRQRGRERGTPRCLGPLPLPSRGAAQRDWQRPGEQGRLLLAESGEGGSGARRGLFRVREAPGRAPGQPFTAPRRGQLGPAGGGEVRALRGGTRAAPRPPPPGERRAPPRCSEGRSGGTAPTAPLRVGSRGRALSPTAPRGGHRSPQLTLAGGRPGPRGRRRHWKLRPRSGPAPWRRWRGRNAIGALRCPPTIPRQDGIPLTAPHRAFPTAEPRASPACYPQPLRTRSKQVAGRRLSQSPQVAVSTGTGSREGRRGRGGAAGVGAPLPRVGQAAPRKEPALGALRGSAREAPAGEGEGRLQAGSAAPLASAPPAMAHPAPRQAPLPPAKYCQGF